MYPTSLLLVLLVIPAALSCGLLYDDSWLWALLVLDAIVVAVIGFDAVFGGMRREQVELSVVSSHIWSRGRKEVIRLELVNPSTHAWSGAIIPDLPRALACAEAPVSFTIQPRERMIAEFSVTAAQRGRFELRGALLAMTSTLGLWRRVIHVGEVTVLHVYPDLRQLGDYTLLARGDRLSLIGVQATRRIGGDTEFERLRDWHGDDEVNRIDWKATARRDQITVRDYQINQSQCVMLMIDAGRMMASRAQRGGGSGGSSGGSDVSQLDLAIESALMLAHVAIRQNDRVGLIAYADSVVRWVPPQGGVRQLHRLIHAVHDLEPTLVESRHDLAYMHLGRHSRKRSLITVFTHVLDDVNADMVFKHSVAVVGRHVPLIVLLRDPDIHLRLRQPPATEAEFWTHGAAAVIVEWRQHVCERLVNQGALVVDADADHLTPETISAYLRVKARHLL